MLATKNIFIAATVASSLKQFQKYVQAGAQKSTNLLIE